MNPLGFGNAILEFLQLHAEWTVLAIARPYGFTLIFYAFAWGKVNAGIIRMGFAMAIAMPSIDSIPPNSSVHDLEWPYMALLLKEMLLGFILGIFASIPLASSVAAGGIIDIYRGAMTGSPDPAGGEMPPVANLLAVISLWVFAALGGFYVVAQLIYASYEIWPAVEPLPRMIASSGVLLEFVGKIVLAALVLAGPMLAVLFFSDVIHLISTKFGKQINVSHLAFSSKNLLMIIILPVYLVYAFQAMQTGFGGIGQSLDFVRRIFE